MGVCFKNKLTVLLLLCLFFSVTLAAGLVRSGRESTRKTVQSSLLNKKYVENVTMIRISLPVENLGKRQDIVLSRSNRGDGSRWLVSLPGSGSSVLADSGKAGQLLGLLSATDTFTVTTESYKDWNSLGVTDEKGVTVTVRGTDGKGNETDFSSLCFGYVTAAETHIAVRNDRKPTVYHVKDMYSAFFTSDAQFWCKKELFPDLNAALSGSVSEIRIQQGDNTRVLYPGEEKFDAAATVYKSITGGQFLFDMPDVQNIPGSGAVSREIEITVIVEIGSRNGLFWKVSLFKTEEGQYIAQCLSPWDSKYVTVSKWTAQRLFI